MPTILVNDGMDSSAKQKLIDKGYNVIDEHFDGDTLHQKLQEVDCIVLRSATKLRQPEIDAALKGQQLKLIVRAGVGIDNIDHEYANDHGIIVRNTPNSSSDAVAELAIGHMFALARNIYIANVTMREGMWNKKQYRGIELAGKTLGLVGFGRIAQRVADKAMALGMTVIYTDIKGPYNGKDACEFVEKDDLLKRSDFISLHIPYNKKQGPYLAEKEFKQMKDGMYIIQAARGGVIDESALLKALDDGVAAKAALDVFEEEPVKNEAIYTHPNISLTPHIGAATYEAQARIGIETIQVIEKYLS